MEIFLKTRSLYEGFASSQNGVIGTVYPPPEPTEKHIKYI